MSKLPVPSGVGRDTNLRLHRVVVVMLLLLLLLLLINEQCIQTHSQASTCIRYQGHLQAVFVLDKCCDCMRPFDTFNMYDPHCCCVVCCFFFVAFCCCVYSPFGALPSALVAACVICGHVTLGLFTVSVTLLFFNYVGKQGIPYFNDTFLAFYYLHSDIYTKSARLSINLHSRSEPTVRGMRC